MSYPSYLIEIATTDYESTRNAVKGDADRIELCANLGEGGTTPSYGLIKKCREHFDIALYPIIRIRGGDFYYTDEEFECMLEDALICKELECDGISTGILKQNGDVDIERMKKMIDTVYPLGITFHRAFDRCRYPLKALEQLIGIGCERILTSGQQLKAPDGALLIQQLNEQANGRIKIMPGSGVTVDTVASLAEITGCTEFHASLRELVPSKMHYVSSAFKEDPETNAHPGVDADKIKALRKALIYNKQ